MPRRIRPLLALPLLFACGGDDSVATATAGGSATENTTSAGPSETDDASTTMATSTGPEGSDSDEATSSDDGMTTSTTGVDPTEDTGTSSESTTTDGTTTDGTTTDGTTDGTTTSTTGEEAICGDGIVQDGEVCDDGKNDGSYNSCAEDCQGFGPYCGDGIVDEGYELCDDGNDIDDDACGNDCGASQCAEIMVVVEPKPPNIMLVVDKSGSMVSNTWDHDQDPNTPEVTRWYSLHGVVDTILTGFQDKLSLGLTLFPSLGAQAEYNASACPVEATPEVAVALNNKDAILGLLPGPESDGATIMGGTPASSGMVTALDHLKSLDPTFPRAVLLITDGAANCTEGADPPPLFETYNAAIHGIVNQAWKDDQIPTYVVGIAISKEMTPVAFDGEPDGIVPHDKLNQLAVEGGKPKDGVDKFYATQSQIELQAALDQIILDALSCTVDLDEPPAFPNNTKIIIDGMAVPQVADCDNESGWAFTDMEYSTIELCGTWCTNLKIIGEADVEYHCTPG